MKKKLASVLLCAVMAASMLTGCGNADNATATTPATDNKTNLKLTKYGRSWLRNIPRRPVSL